MSNRYPHRGNVTDLLTNIKAQDSPCTNHLGPL